MDVCSVYAYVYASVCTYVSVMYACVVYVSVFASISCSYLCLCIISKHVCIYMCALHFTVLTYMSISEHHIYVTTSSVLMVDGFLINSCIKQVDILLSKNQALQMLYYVRIIIIYSVMTQ